MNPLLLLIDFQNDFLRVPALEPAAGVIVERAAVLLNACRSLSIAVVHVWTTVRRHDDQRMPHWKRLGKWWCVEGTEGHSPPATLQPTGTDQVVHKTFFSAFSGGDLDRLLAAHGADTVLMAGLYLHGCIRETALHAYERGLAVYVADDAVASDDPLHAAMTRRYLQSKTMAFVAVANLVAMLNPPDPHASRKEALPSVLPCAIISEKPVCQARLKALLHYSPRRPQTALWSVPVCEAEQVDAAAAAARRAWPGWARTGPLARASLLERLADHLQHETIPLATQMAKEVGKPLAQGRGEAARTAALLRAVAQRAALEQEHGSNRSATFRHRSVGVIVVITPWNNPLFLPLGKLAPALLYGNTVLWKPAPAGSAIAVRVMEYLAAAGCPPGVVNLVCGDRSTADIAMMAAPVDAVTLTGSSLAGYSAQEICGRRRMPLQAELGGNNAALVWSDADLVQAAKQIAEGAFGMAGQRCTANRRVVVDQRCYRDFLHELSRATAELAWGDPLKETTQVGPLISTEQCTRVAAAVARAAGASTRVIVPHRDSSCSRDLAHVGTYFPPTILCCDDAQQEIVQEETFGPVLVVQRASDWEEAIKLCNGVRQGLVAACFSRSEEQQQRFLFEAQAGILKINHATADAAVDLPFGGWKGSGIGPPEHGDSDREFYTRTQALYH